MVTLLFYWLTFSRHKNLQIYRASKLTKLKSFSDIHCHPELIYTLPGGAVCENGNIQISWTLSCKSPSKKKKVSITSDLLHEWIVQVTVWRIHNEWVDTLMYPSCDRWKTGKIQTYEGEDDAWFIRIRQWKHLNGETWSGNGSVLICKGQHQNRQTRSRNGKRLERLWPNYSLTCCKQNCDFGSVLSVSYSASCVLYPGTTPCQRLLITLMSKNINTLQEKCLLLFILTFPIWSIPAHV